jgi:hypothetical protein
VGAYPKQRHASGVVGVARRGGVLWWQQWCNDRWWTTATPEVLEGSVKGEASFNQRRGAKAAALTGERTTVAEARTPTQKQWSGGWGVHWVTVGWGGVVV